MSIAILIYIYIYLITGFTSHNILSFQHLYIITNKTLYFTLSIQGKYLTSFLSISDNNSCKYFCFSATTIMSLHYIYATFPCLPPHCSTQHVRIHASTINTAHWNKTLLLCLKCQPLSFLIQLHIKVWQQEGWRTEAVYLLGVPYRRDDKQRQCFS